MPRRAVCCSHYETSHEAQAAAAVSPPSLTILSTLMGRLDANIVVFWYLLLRPLPPAGGLLYISDPHEPPACGARYSEFRARSAERPVWQQVSAEP